MKVPYMPRERYIELQQGKSKLTEEEIAQGWFFDDEYDGLLANKAWDSRDD